MQHFKTLGELHRANGLPAPEHPLLSLIRCANACNIGDREFTGDFYMIGLKKLKEGVIMYGRTPYDHSNGSMMFAKPRQIIQMKGLEFEEDGFLIYIHEDFLNGYELHNTIKKYGYFDYEVNEALHLSPREDEIIWELYNKIAMEYNNNPDEFSRDIMIGHLASILTYAQRFYKRQFINRTELSGKTVSRFNAALTAYMEAGGLQNQGLPSVNVLAETLHLSPRYLSDLLKQETGKTAMDLIHLFLIAEAKNLLKSDTHNISDVAYQLGFENTSYFTRLFKKQVGMKPLEFKKMQLN